MPATPRPSRRRPSLRLRLTLLTSGLLCVALAVGAVVLTGVLQRSRVAALDDVLRDRVATVAELSTADRLPGTLPVSEPGEIAQLLDSEGLVAATSPNASRTLPLLPLAFVEDAGEQWVGTTTQSGYDDEVRAAVRGTTFQGAPAYAVATLPLGEVQGLVDALSLSLAVVVPVLTLLLGVTIWVVLGRALRPVDEMRRAAADVVRRGGSGSLPVPEQEELGALALTLNDLLDRLQSSAARQRTFVADAAHELRSPIAALRASLEVAAAHPEAYATPELVADLGREVLRMQGLVDDLLLLARVGSTPARVQDVDLAAVVAEVADRAQVTGAGRARGDAGAIGRVVRNLVENAVRHAATAVRVTVADGAVTVDDDGAGIAPEDRARVFERFVRLDDAREREAGGSGLGLAIAREVAREQGGDVELADSPLGGLRAVLRLPVA